jgi:hypothetical protein
MYRIGYLPIAKLAWKVHYYCYIPGLCCGPWECMSVSYGRWWKAHGTPGLPAHGYSGDCQPWLLNVQSAMNPTSGGRIAGYSIFYCAASVWSRCAATSASTVSSGFAEA